MADNQNQQQDPRTKVRVSNRLWSQEVGAAQAETLLPEKEPGYVFSNGRRFDDGKGPYSDAS
ncbi:hypothetical protein [Pseudothauera rhizosphaerae]|uniref:Uncharacterized protein n=1 Tax=Pseudothauera rhizosphaerae TaxID=2565932 RepID=A0A4S4AAJ7_9RHOO|nr:hypothetical protein [Pseudothauera rhizosphaerae]THF55926.1 hypothetical protein E6O51_20280 [Pseudothauera rhizosphaerae]